MEFFGGTEGTAVSAAPAFNFAAPVAVVFGERFQRAADHGVAAVNRLEDVEVELFSARHADVETVALNRFVNALRVNRENLLRAFKWRVVQRAAVHRAEHRLLFFGQRARLRRRGRWRRRV